MREFELRFNGLYESPEVIAVKDGMLKDANEVIHVIEKSAFDLAVEALQRIGDINSAMNEDPTRMCSHRDFELRLIARDALTDLGVES